MSTAKKTTKKTATTSAPGAVPPASKKQATLSFTSTTRNPSTPTKDLNDIYLSRVQEMVTTLNSTNGANDKLELVKQFGDLKELLSLVYDPLKPFHITSEAVQKFKKTGKTVQPIEYGSIIEFLKALDQRETSGHEALASAILWTTKYPHHTNLLYNLIDKDLKIRMGVSQLNKAFSGLIEEFKVVLGHPIEKYPKALDKGAWKISRKLDGVRCLTVVNGVSSGGKISFFSRAGNEFLTLSVLESVIRKYVQPLFPNGVVLDGEVCVIESNGSENFKGVMTEIKKKDHTMKHPRYLLFDCLTLTEFSSGTSERIFSERLKDLDQIKAATNVPGSNVPELLVIDQVNYTPEKLADMSELVEKHGWEGLMVRKDAKYEGKRTSSVLKVKKFQREEYKVVDTQVGPYQALNKDTGLTETIETMVSVTILHKNYPVSVGSGFSLEERKQYYKNPEKIKGKIISVQFFEETEGSDGNLSLRFPTFKGLYGNTRTI